VDRPRTVLTRRPGVVPAASAVVRVAYAVITVALDALTDSSDALTDTSDALTDTSDALTDTSDALSVASVDLPAPCAVLTARSDIPNRPFPSACVRLCRSPIVPASPSGSSAPLAAMPPITIERRHKQLGTDKNGPNHFDLALGKKSSIAHAPRSTRLANP
ncbi:MAG: hypothetical protein ACHQWU_00515, partial [Gemmatimonadales bacterium]